MSSTTRRRTPPHVTVAAVSMLLLGGLAPSCTASGSSANGAWSEPGRVDQAAPQAQCRGGRFESEYYIWGQTRGEVSLDAEAQILSFSLRGEGRTQEVEVRLDELLPDGYRARTFSQIDGSSLVLGGTREDVGGGWLARLRYDAARGAIHRDVVPWSDPRLLSVDDLRGLPGRESVAVLDAVGHSVFEWDPASQELRLIAAGEAYPVLRDAHHLLCLRTEAENGVVLMATKEDVEEAPGPWMGPSLTMADRDGDGVFESIH